MKNNGYINFWTKPRVEHLKRRWAEGATASQIADELGPPCTKNAVIGKSARLKLERRKAGPQIKKVESEPRLGSNLVLEAARRWKLIKFTR